MQNKPNLRKSQMNLNLYNTKDYERKRDWTLGENKPNLSRRSLWRSRIQTQSNPIAERVKLMQSVYLQRIMKINGCGESGETNPTCRGVASGEAGFEPNSNPNKANFKRNEYKLLCCRVLSQSSISPTQSSINPTQRAHRYNLSTFFCEQRCHYS